MRKFFIIASLSLASCACLALLAGLFCARRSNNSVKSVGQWTDEDEQEFREYQLAMGSQ